MNIPEIEFTRFAVYLFLLLAVILFFVFRLLGKVVPVLPIKKDRIKILTRYLPGIELFIWVLFFIWAIQYFWKNNQLYSMGLFLVLIMLLLWVSWFALKDFIAGAIFKASKSFNINESIKIDNYSGRIIQFKNRSLIIETDSGETIHFPYTQLLGKVIIKSSPSEMIQNKTIFLNISKKDPLFETIRNIKTDILNLPWSSIKKEPQIKPIGENNNSFELEIVIFAIETEYFYKIESWLKEKYSSN